MCIITMLLMLDDVHKQHINILISQSEVVLQDFCKLAAEYLKKGPNPKLYQSAAQKLNVQTDVIRCAVEGLLHLLMRSCNEKLSEEDFRTGLSSLGFSDPHQDVLCTFYESKREEITLGLSSDSLELPHFKDLEWRFETQLASRALQSQVTPLVTMKLSLEQRRGVMPVGQESLVLQTDPTNLVHLARVMEEALAEAKSQHTRRIQRHLK